MALWTGEDRASEARRRWKTGGGGELIVLEGLKGRPMSELCTDAVRKARNSSYQMSAARASPTPREDVGAGRRRRMREDRLEREETR